MSIHEGHRKRLRQRFMQDGLDNFDEINVLELMLFYSIPRADTNDLAHRLLEQFGSLANVLDASVEELAKVKGIGENAAVLLHLFSAVSRYYQVQRADMGQPMTGVEAFSAVLLPKFIGRRNEMVYLLCLDAKYKMICCRLIGEGNVNSASISARKIVEVALAVNATSVVLAHNHPSGLAIPSAADVNTTLHIGRALQAVDVDLLDHIVVADDEAVSMVQSGLFRSADMKGEVTF